MEQPGLAVSQANSGKHPSGAARVGYDRSQISAGILHFGVGNFHRAHQAVYLDRLFESGLDYEWAVVGAGIFESEIPYWNTLRSQRYMFSVVEQSPNASRARVVGSLIDFVKPGDTVAILAKLGHPKIRIVSLTITEGGYFIDADSGHFNVTHPDIVHDAQTPDSPKTVFGLLVAALKARRDARVPSFTIMSCDNIPHNGRITRNAVCGLARLCDPQLADWIAQSVAFPNSMVDRITPATGDRERDLIRTEFGIEDKVPVFCEDYIQWVLEDNFSAGRPSLEKVGAQFVPDVTPFENMKIRILNGGHAVIAYPGGLLDIEFVHEAMEHPMIAAFLQKVELEEILPVVPPVPGTCLHQYLAKVTERFGNPQTGDTVRRLCLDGSNRQPKFIIPSICDRAAKGLGFEGLALESALWCRYCFGVSEFGKVIEPNDPNWDALKPIAQKAKEDPIQWIGQRSIYGALGDDEAFAKSFSFWLGMLWTEGTVATLDRYVKSGLSST